MRSHALRRLASKYARPYLGRMTLVFIGALGSISAGVAIPRVTKAAVDLVHDIRRGLKPASEASFLWQLGAILVALAVVETCLAFMRRNLAQRVSLRMETQIRDDFYWHLQSLPVSEHDNWQSGQLLSRAVYDINAIRRFIGFGAVFLMVATIQMTAIVIMLFGLDPVLAVVTTIVVAPIGWISTRFSRRYRKISRRVQEEQGDLGTIIEEAATGVRIIKAFGRSRLMMDKFEAQASKLRESNLEGVKTRAFNWSLFGFIANLNIVIILLLGGFAVARGTLSLGGLVAFLSYLTMMIFPLDILGWILAMGEEAATAAERVYEIFDTTPEIRDRPGAVAVAEVSGHVAFEDVWFRYGEDSEFILKGVNLDVRAGETLALVGRTGCGKTTAASLVPRLYQVTEGRVTLDGRDVADFTLDSLRSHIGVAFEDPILFSASVRENLLMGRPDANEADIEAALETAQARFVDDLPWGLDTRVGEQGYTLSGGQRQRLALARAVLGRPRVLVLDDPLSSVDVHTEAMIEGALESVLEGVTALLIVHRPSTLALADRVALLDEGRIVAVGTHHDLLEEEPLYRAILSQEAEEVAV